MINTISQIDPLIVISIHTGFPRWLNCKDSAGNARDTRHGFDPCVGKIPWRRKWQPTPVFLPGEFHGQRNLLGYSPWAHKRVKHDLSTKQLTAIRHMTWGLRTKV